MTSTPPSAPTPNAALNNTAQEFIEKLRNALKRDGDFPANAKVVSELRMLVSDPKTTANQITEIILKEPSLGTRVLHLVNSSFYRRAKPIMTVSQAVIQIGMRPLAELCAGLVLLQKFIPAARRGGPFAACLQRTIITSLLASSISSGLQAQSGSNRGDETGYLAGSFFELGTLLLAYYFPQVYENALKRAETKKLELGKCIEELTGLSPIQLSLEVIDALNLPDYYRQALLAVSDVAIDRQDAQVPDARKTFKKLGQTLFASQKISSVLVHSKNKQDLETAIVSLSGKLGVDKKALGGVVGDLPRSFKNHCNSIDIVYAPLPDYVAAYSPNPTPQTTTNEEAATGPDSTQFQNYVEEIREAVENREPTASVITRVMETFAWSLSFDRVLLLLLGQGKRKLQGRMMLGVIEDQDPKSIERSLGEEDPGNFPELVAYRESRPVFNGNSLLADGWPFCVIPIGFGQRCIGVIYADRTSKTSAELNPREQAAIGVLTELLDRSVNMHSK